MMSLHKLTAGDGYTYLTRQVAAHDTTERGYSSLGDYYAGKGESPGVWAGGGLTSLGLEGQVTEQHMKNLFGAGLHPNAERLEAETIAGLPKDTHRRERMRIVNRAVRLGQPFKQMTIDSTWSDRLAGAYERWNTDHDQDPHDAVPAGAKERIRTDLVNEMFAERHGRVPVSVAERSGFLAQVSRPSRTAVAGFDVTFSPVKSVSTLWAVAPPATSRQVENAHHAAVSQTLAWLEKEAGYTRLGTNGPAQVPVRGLIMARFTHRDSRAGDPDLHTHVAVSNKVQTTDGRWLALDARMLYRLNVAASERYNTALEAEITQRTGAVFADRGDHTGKRAVREIVGIDERLNKHWSSRRRQIVTSRTELAAQFLARHGRLPTTVEMIKLAQQATLDTREHKHEPRSFAEQRVTWAAEAADILGGTRQIGSMVDDVLQAHPAPFASVTDELITTLAEQTVRSVADSRAHWHESNLVAEAQRQVRTANIDPSIVLAVADQVVTRCVSSDLCVPIGTHNEVDTAVPQALLRTDGTSVYTMAKGQLYTSAGLIAAEQRVLDTAGRTRARCIDEHDVEIAALAWSANHDGHQLNTAQAAMVTDIATSDRYLQLALAPAGTGKTTVMGVLASAWTGSGGNVLGLAPQASAAQELAAAIPGVEADTIDKLVHDITHTPPDKWARWIDAIDHDSLVIIDEAGLASTPKLDAAIAFVTGRGGRVLLVGDDQQRAAIGAGGLLRDMESTHGSLNLTEVLRFTDPLEGQASLALRQGDPGAVGYYTDRNRLHAVTPDTAADTVFTRWFDDTTAGADSIMIAPTLTMVTALNARARQARIAQLTAPGGPELELLNGETVSAGDVIITKRNQRRLAMGGTDFVRNNYRWEIRSINSDGSITATEKTRKVTRTIPSWYIHEGWVRLGYAHTHASVQGMTIGKAHVQRGTAHAVINAGMTRNDLYPALTRAADGTHAYVVLGGEGDTHDVTTPQAIQPATAVETLTAIIGTDGSARSVTTEQREAANAFTRLGPAVDAYVHALTVAAETVVGPDKAAEIDAAADRVVPGVTDAPAWETLRGHLMMLAAEGRDPIAALDTAAKSRELSTARDSAAVLDFRLDPTGNHSQQPGPLPWTPGIPTAVTSNATWAKYLTTRSDSIARFAGQIRESVEAWTPQTAPSWALPYLANTRFATELALWRASEFIDDTDLRPAGPMPRRIAMIRRHRGLTDQALKIGGDVRDGADRWAKVLADHGVDILGDDYWPVLAPRLNLADTAGLPVHTLLEAASRQGPLPAEGAAAALWWRLAPHIGDLAAGPTAGSHQLRPPWTVDLDTVLGSDRANRIVQDRLWPVIVSRVDTVTREGSDPSFTVTSAAQMLARSTDTVADHDAATVLLWNIATLTDPEPPEQDAVPSDPADDDLTPPTDAHDLIDRAALAGDRSAVEAVTDQAEALLPPSSQEGATMDSRPVVTGSATYRLAHQERHPDQHGLGLAAKNLARTSPDRLKEANAAAQEFFTTSAKQSWVPTYLASRGLDPLAAGYAPSGSHLVHHLRQLGFADTEMLDAGLARQSDRGVYDFFRNRLTLPYHDTNGAVVGFMARKAPTDTNDHNTKYLNSPDTAIFHKKQLPLGLDNRTVEALRAGSDIALVEGPMDALAINTATDRHGLVAVATGGTALTSEQLLTLDQVAPLVDRRVLVLMDNDPAGETAAAKAHDTLASNGFHGVLTTDPLPAKDASQLMQEQGPQALRYALDLRRPLEDLVVDRIQHVYAHQWGPRDMKTIEARLNVLYSSAPVVAEMGANERNRQTIRLADNLGLRIVTVFNEVEGHRVGNVDYPRQRIVNLAKPSSTSLRDGIADRQITKQPLQMDPFSTGGWSSTSRMTRLLHPGQLPAGGPHLEP